MASYRQLPEVFRRLHPQFKTPWLSLLVFAGIAPILILLPGDVNFVGTLYSLGATLSFTVAHASLVRLRVRDRRSTETPSTVPTRTCGSRRRRRAALRDPRRDRDGGLVRGDRRPEPDDALGRPRVDDRRACPGTGSTVVGSSARVRETVKAPPAMGAALALEYRRILVPDRSRTSVRRRARRRAAARAGASLTGDRAVGGRGAARAADRHAAPRGGGAANRELDEAVALGDTYGVRVTPRLVRGGARRARSWPRRAS